jgi:methyl coenzyme M reductase gamma subunit
MKLDNQKNGWKGVCVYHETNGEEFLCPVRALGRRYVHIRKHGGTKTTTLSSYWIEGARADVTAENISRALKLAATELQYPTNKGIPISRINTHSLRSGGANSLALNGYSDTQIQKMGRWRGATFKEYIREELACYARNMSRDMKRKFNFVNIAGNAFTEIPHTELHIIEPEE